MTRVLIVDDLNSIREFLKINLSSEPDIEVVGLADNGSDAIAQVEEHQPDLVLMDINMPGKMDGIQATEKIMQRFPNSKVLLLTSQDDRQQLDRALMAGSRGYILKNTSIKDIANIIRLAEKGFFQIGPIMGNWDGSFHNIVMSSPRLEIGRKGAGSDTTILSLPDNFSNPGSGIPNPEMQNTLSNLSSELFELQKTIRSQENTINNLSSQYSQVQQKVNDKTRLERSPSKAGSFSFYGAKPKKSRTHKRQHVLFITSFFLGVVTVLLLVFLIVVFGSI